METPIRNWSRSRWLAVALIIPGVIPALVPARSIAAESLLSQIGTDAWLARLASPDASVRRGAVGALGRFAPPEPRVTSALHDVLQRETDVSVQLAAVAAMATLRHPQSQRWLQQVASGSLHGVAVAPEVQQAAVRAWGVTADPTIVLPLLRTSNNAPELADVTARTLALQSDLAFGQLLTMSRRFATQTVIGLRSIGYRGDPRWAPIVLDQLTASNSEVLQTALDVAGRMRLVEAARTISELARSASNAPVRRAALRALAALGDAGDGEAIRAGIRTPLTRNAALEAASALGDRSFVPDVAALLDEPWPADRRIAAETLGALGGSQAAAVITAHLEGGRAPTSRVAGASNGSIAVTTREPSPDVRAVLWHALARVGGSESIARIARAAVRDPDARWALVELRMHRDADDVVMPDMRAAIARSEPSALALAGVFGGFDASLVSALSSPDAGVRATAAMALSWRATQSADAALVSRLAIEDDEGVRTAIVLALGASGGTVARGALAALARRERDTPSVAGLAAGAVAGRIGLREVAPELRSWLGSPRPLVRSVAANALGGMRDPSARPALENAGRFDVDPDVRGIALVALADIAGARSLDAINWTGRVAWTASLEDRVRRADSIARGARRRVPFAGAAVVRLSGAPPRSVWTLAQPDGAVLFAVASGDGEVLIPGAPAASSPLRRLESP